MFLDEGADAVGPQRLLPQSRFSARLRCQAALPEPDAGRNLRLSAAAVEENPMRDIIKLTCGTCSRANYHTTKNKRTMTEKFVIKKFCPACRKHLEHKEGKISRG